MSLLADITGPADLKRLTPEQVPVLAAAARAVDLVAAALRGERYVPRL